MDHSYSGNGGDSYVGGGGGSARGPERHRRGSRDSYAPRPYDRPASHGGRSQNSHERGRRLEDVYDTDELLSVDQFRRYHQEGSSISWEEYVRNHRRAALERFFARHKGEAWIGERYDPFRGPVIESAAKEACNERALRFKGLLEEGKFDSLVLVDGPDLEGGDASSTSTNAGTASGGDSSPLSVRNFPAAMRLPERLSNTIDRTRLPTITLSNISPALTRETLEEMLRSCASNNSGSQLLSLELSEPIPEKANYRLGWTTWAEGTELGPIVTAIEDYVPPTGPGGSVDKIYCSASKTFSWQIRVSEGHGQRLERDLEQASTLANRLDGLRGVEQTGILNACRERSNGDNQRFLDMILIYLRHVHYVCYYSAAAGTGPHDLARQAGDLVIRCQVEEDTGASTVDSNAGTSSSATSGIPSPATDFDHAIADLQERLTVQYEPFTEDALLERHVAKVEEGRYRCTHCSKLFKGVDFVIKHLRLKHEDLTRGVILEVATLNAFLKAPSLTIQLSLPKSVSHREPQHRRDERYGRSNQHSHNNQSERHHGGRDYRRRAHLPPPPPPKDAVADPRRLRQYVDWDAPATGDMEISYD